VADPLVYYRVGATAFKRRGGTSLLRSELRLQREFRRRRFTSAAEYARNVAIRGGYRLIPWWLRRAIYRPLVGVVSWRATPPAATPAQQPGWEYTSEWRNPEEFAAGMWRQSKRVNR